MNLFFESLNIYDYQGDNTISYEIHITQDSPFGEQNWTIAATGITATQHTLTLNVGEMYLYFLYNTVVRLDHCSYYFRIYPINAAGKGSYVSIKYTVIVNPDVVGDVDVIEVEPHSMTIAFVPPWNGGGYITGCIYLCLNPTFLLNATRYRLRVHHDS